MEQFRRAFKASQKYIEKDLAALTSSTGELAQKSGMGTLQPEDACKSLDAMTERLQKLKRKVSFQAFSATWFYSGGREATVRQSANSLRLC